MTEGLVGMAGGFFNEFFPDIDNPDDFKKIQSEIDSQIDAEGGDGNDNVIYRITRKDGEVRWVDDYGHYAYSPEYGDLYYVFINDITERKKMMDEMEKYRNLGGRPE